MDEFKRELNALAQDVINSYVNLELRLAITESVTGGYIGHVLTNQDGCSRIFGGSLVVYSALAKELVLDIPMDFIQKYGTVSEEMCGKMLEGMDKFPIDVALSTTGVAGKEIEGQPHGTVFIGAKCASKKEIKKFKFTGSRLEIKQQAAMEALKMLLRTVEHLEKKK